MNTLRRVVLATGNAGKQREFAQLLAPLGMEILIQSALGIAPAEETGTTFEANALLKARHAARGAQLPALADDSGIEVDALDGRPGVYSARFAGPDSLGLDDRAWVVNRASVPGNVLLVSDEAPTSWLTAAGLAEAKQFASGIGPAALLREFGVAVPRGVVANCRFHHQLRPAAATQPARTGPGRRPAPG